MNKETFDKLFDEYNPWQRREQFLELVNIIENRKPKVILEIGVGYGGSFKFWEILIPDDGLLIGMDVKDNMKWDNPSTKEVFLIMGNCHDPQGPEILKDLLDGREIDFLYIDADHTYKSTELEFERYKKFCSPNAIVAFHDIRAVENVERYKDYGVGKFFTELKKKYQTMTILIDDFCPDGGSDGIGIVFLKENGKESI